jgi:hypothetical protein
VVVAMMSMMAMMVMGMARYRTRSDIDFLPVVSLLWSRKGEAHCELFVTCLCLWNVMFGG